MTTTTYTKDQIIAIGGREWAGRRVYINNWHPYAGLTTIVRKTGSIADATLSGEHISNRCGHNLRQAKVYLDLATGEIRTDLADRAAREYVDVDAMLARLYAGIADAVRAATVREMSTRQVAAELGVSIRTVQRRAAAGKLAGRKDSRGRWIITL